MSDVFNASVATDDDVLGSHLQIQRRGQPAVIDHDRHRKSVLFAKRLDRLWRITESDVHRDYREIVTRSFVALLKLRHLLAAGHAPRRPKLQVHGLPAVELTQIDGLAVDRLERDLRRRRSYDR